MKSYWMEGREGQLHIEMRDVYQPQVGAGQLLVKIHAAGLNRGEFILGPGPHGGLPQAVHAQDDLKIAAQWGVFIIY